VAQFSRNTIFEAFDALPLGGTFKREHAQIRQFALRFNLEEVLDGLGSAGVEPKVTALIEHVILNPDAKGPSGSALAFEIVEYALKHRLKPWGYDPSFRNPEEEIPDLLHSLKADGYRVDGDRLVPDLPAELEFPHVESRLEELLDHYGFTTGKGHLQQGRSAYVRGDWAAANGQLRSFVESVFHEMAGRMGGHAVKSGVPAIQFIAAQPNPIIDEALNESDKAANGFVPWFWRRLHPQGSHPGLSDEQDATLRLRLVLVVMTHYLELFAARLP